MTERTPSVVLDQAGYAAVQADIVALLEAARRAAARSVNAMMTASYWEIGRRIVEFEQAGKERAAYGQALLKRLSADLSARFGRGFSERNLEQMRLFYLSWPQEKISQTASAKLPSTRIAQTASVALVSGSNAETVSRNFIDLASLAHAFPLPWSAYVRLLSVKNPQARAFYETETLRCGWSVRQLDRQVNSQFYERTALSTNKAGMLEKAEAAEAHYALEGLPNKVLAAEYQTVLPDEKLLAEELDKTRRDLEARRIVRGGDAEGGE